MKKILALALFAVALVSCRQTMQTDGFKLSGHLEGLQVGDTLFLKTFLLPDWKEDGTDTILVEKEGIFSAFIPMEHTTFYLLTHQPKVGEPLRSCIRGAEIIARVGDDIKLEGSLDYLIAFGNPAGCTQHQGQCQLGRRTIDRFRGIGHSYTLFTGIGDIDIIITHSIIAD